MFEKPNIQTLNNILIKQNCEGVKVDVKSLWMLSPPVHHNRVVSRTDCFSFLQRLKNITEQNDGQFSILFLAVGFLLFKSKWSELRLTGEFLD